MSEELSKEKTALFETMAPYKAVTKLCLPTVMGCLVMVLYSLADTYFVGIKIAHLLQAEVFMRDTILLILQ